MRLQKITQRFTLILSMLLLFTGVSMANEISTPGHSQGNDSYFPECPDTPNCVSSLAKNPAKKVEPFPMRDGPSQSMELLNKIIRSMPRTTIVLASKDKIQVEYRSLLGFVDDVLFVVSLEENIIHVRSASRKGHWDLGVNRRRLDKIRREYSGSEP